MEIPKERESKITSEEKYRILINARNFHYENFSKWLTYFYIAIGALFVGYCSIVASEENKSLEYLLIILGFILSLLWYWSAKGYYFWNINFINLVNYYERDILKFEKSERVYSFFANKKTQNNYFNPISGANISTSKVAILFAFVITVAWAFIFYNTIINCECGSFYSVIICATLSLLTVVILSCFIPKYCLKSYIDHFPDMCLKFEEDDPK